MKKCYLFAIGLILSNSLHSQNYVPLLIDSLYNWSWNLDMFGDTIVEESWSAYSYDLEDALIQQRTPISITDYSYATDSVFLVSQLIDADNNWNIFGRSTLAYHNGKIMSRLNERHQNNAFENSALYTYYYDAANLDILTLLQHWDDGAWTNFYKKEKTFDANGNNVEEAEYYTDSNDVFDYNRGKLYEYDNDNRRIQLIRVNDSSSGPYYTLRTNWAYGNNDQIDSISSCSYTFPNTETCNNVSMTAYDYSMSDHTVARRFNWNNDQWRYIGKELTFAGPEIYSNQPDSVFFYDYLDDVFVPRTRRYLQYEDLGEDKIYFKEEKYRYFSGTDEWLFTDLKEEWYHLNTIVDVDAVDNLKASISVFPNPSKIGQNLNFKIAFPDEENLEVLVFDMQGRLISRNLLVNPPSVQAPNKAGIYTILIRQEGRLIGVEKQVVVE